MTITIQTVNEFRESLEAILRKLCEAIQCDLITLHLYDSEHEQLYLPVGINLVEEKIFYRSVPSMDRVAGRVVRTRDFVIANDAEHHPDLTGPFTHREKIKSAAGFPVKRSTTEEVLGVVFVSYRVPHVLRDNEIEQMRTSAGELATVIEDAFKGIDGQNLRFYMRSEAGLRQKGVRLRGILERLTNVLRNVDVALWLPQKGEPKLVVSAGAGIIQNLFDSAQIDISSDSQNPIVDVFVKGEKAAVDKYQENASSIFGIDMKTPWESMHLFPVRSEYHSLGVLSLFRRDSFDFSNQELDTITAFTNLLAVTIENEERIITLYALHDLGVRLTLSQNQKQVLDEIVRNTCQIIGADIATILLYDPSTQQFLEMDKAAVYPESAKEHMEKPRIGGFTNEILKKRRIYVEDVDNATGFSTSTFIKDEGVKAYVGTPLISNGDSLGVMYVSFRHPRRFSPDELSLIQIMANYASTAVHRTKLSDQQIAVAEIARNIARNLEIGKILQTILEKTLELLHCQIGSIALYDLTADELDFKYAVGKKTARRSKSGKGLMGEAALTRKPVRVADVTKSENYVPYDKSTQSELDVPLLIGDELVGVLNIESSRLNAFSPEDENLAMTLASQAAIAIVNARLLEDARSRAEALRSLYNVATDMVSITDAPDVLEEILTRIAHSAQSALGADLVDIYQYWKAKDEFTLPPVGVGERLGSKVVKTKIYRDDVLYKIVEGGEPLFILDAQSNQAGLVGSFLIERANRPRDRFVVREKVLSSAALPMIVDGEVVGVLFVNYRTPQTFPAQQKELIGLFSNQAAIAIRNSRLYRQSLMRSERLDLVRQVAAAVSSTTDLEEILQFVVNGLGRVFEVKQSAVTIFDDAGEYATVRKEYMEPGRFTAMGHKIPLKDNPQIEKLLETKKALVVYDVQADPLMVKTRDIMAQRGTLSLMIVPIVIDNEVRGTIGVDAVDERRHFTVEEAELAQAIADQAAAAIRISQQLEERLSDIRALQDITEQMHKGELSAVLSLIAERALRLTRAKHGGVWLVNKNRTELDFGGAAQTGQSEQRPPNISLGPDSDGSISKWVVEHKVSRRSSDVRREPDYKSWYGDTVSELTVPIIYHERVIGTINVESPKESSFTAAHQELLEAMAGQAAVAIQNARLISRMETVDSIGRKLTAGIRLREDKIVELIYQQASQLMDTGNMYIALYDEAAQMISFPLMYVEGEKREQQERKFGDKGIGKTEWIIQERMPLLHAKRDESEAWYAQPGHQEFTGDVLPASWVGVPMQIGAKVLGVVANFHPTQEYLYGQDELDILTAMAGQAAIAIDNARLYYDVNQSLAEANDDLEALVAFGQEVTAKINLTENEILEKIYQHSSQLMDTGNMYIALYDDETKMINFPLMYVGGEKRELPARKFGETGIGKTEWIIRSKQPILHTSLEEAEAWYAQPGHKEFARNPLAAWIGVPMQVGEKILGVIATYHPTKDNVYTDKDLRILQGIARVAAITLENMKLYKEARGEVVAAKQLSTLGTAIAALQHRINNTFNIIIPNVTRLKSRVDLNDPTVVEILDIIERNARYTSEIIARIQEPLKEVEITDININAILGEIVLKKRDSWKSRVTSPLVTPSFNAEERIPIVRGLSGQIAEIFENLMDNAYKSMQKGGEIQVVSELKDGNIIVRVIDCGSGIPLDIQARLFSKPVPSRSVGGGAGLGLWLSRLMLQSIGGDIGIEKSDATGTTMLVTIPVNQDRKES